MLQLRRGVRLGRRGVPEGDPQRQLRRGRRAVRPRLAAPRPGLRRATSPRSPTACAPPPRSAPASGPASASRSWPAAGSSARWTSSRPRPSSCRSRAPRRCATSQQLVSPAAGHPACAREADADQRPRAAGDGVPAARGGRRRRPAWPRSAVGQASTMTAEVEALGSASAAVGDVIAIISGDRRPDQPAGAQRDHRGGPRRRAAARASPSSPARSRTSPGRPPRRPSGSSEQIAGIQASSQSVSAGIHATSEVIGELDAVQTRIGEVLEEQVEMAQGVRAAADARLSRPRRRSRAADRPRPAAAGRGRWARRSPTACGCRRRRA